VVLAIVEPDGLRIDHGAQRIFGIGKGFHREWGTHNRLLFEFGLLGRRPLIIGSKTRKEMAGNGQFRNNRAAELVAGRGSGRMERQEITMTMRMPAAALALVLAVFAAPGRAEMLGHGAMVNSVAVSPDGRQLLSASWDYTVRLWDLEKQAELRVLDGHTASVNTVLFLPDGRGALSGSWDHAIIRWDLASGRETARLTGHVNNVSGIALSRDGRWLASASWDRTAKLWD